MKAKSIISLQDVRKEFMMAGNPLHVLKGISLTIEEGEFVTIMGPSGSGKSTLLNILGCLDQASSGMYELDEQIIRNMNRNELAEIRNQKIGFVFQSYNLLPRTTAVENVELPLLYDNTLTNKEIRERALEALNMVGLSDRLDHTPSQLSGGQQQRVAIARSLVNDPRVILADEATGNLDMKTSFEVMAIFQELNRRGKTIVFVTHEQEIAEFSSRTITFRDGLLLKDTSNANIQNAAITLENYQELEEVWA